MNPGYYSEEAVSALLAIKDGEIDFIKKQNIKLQNRINSLEERLALFKSPQT
jgi:hypothetical protein